MTKCMVVVLLTIYYQQKSLLSPSEVRGQMEIQDHLDTVDIRATNQSNNDLLNDIYVLASKEKWWISGSKDSLIIIKCIGSIINYSKNTFTYFFFYMSMYFCEYQVCQLSSPNDCSSFKNELHVFLWEMGRTVNRTRAGLMCRQNRRPPCQLQWKKGLQKYMTHSQ